MSGMADKIPIADDVPKEVSTLNLPEENFIFSIIIKNGFERCEFIFSKLANKQ